MKVKRLCSVVLAAADDGQRDVRSMRPASRVYRVRKQKMKVN